MIINIVRVNGATAITTTGEPNKLPLESNQNFTREKLDEFPLENNQNLTREALDEFPLEHNHNFTQEKLDEFLPEHNQNLTREKLGSLLPNHYRNTTHQKLTFYRDPTLSSSHSHEDFYDDIDEASIWEIPIDTEHIHEISDADYYSERERYDEFEREVALEFRPLCSTIRRRISLKDDLYEYRPSHFTETLCRKFQPLLTYGPHGYHYKSYSYHKYEQQCAYDGFKCIQRSQILYLSRRRRDTDCWETTRQIIPSGCDCMWPISTLGEIKDIY